MYRQAVLLPPSPAGWIVYVARMAFGALLRGDGVTHGLELWVVPAVCALVNAPLVASAVLGDPALTTLFLGKSSHVLPIARGQDESTLATEWVNVQA